MGRILQSLLSRSTQTWFLTFWKDAEVSDHEAELIAHMRNHAPSLFIAANDATKNCPRKDVGKFLSIIRKCMVVLAMFLIQQPTREQTSEYCETLHNYIQERCSTINTQQLKIAELAEYLECCISERRAILPSIARIEAALLPLCDEDSQRMVAMFNSTLTRTIFNGLMISLRSKFREEWNLAQFIKVSRGFIHEEKRSSPMPDPEILDIQTTLNSDTDEDDYHPTGEPIPLSRFCEPAKIVLAESVCSVCHSDITIDAQGSGEKPVVTACSHYFHVKCLDAWVNESGMRTANTCPSCRAELCEGRPRVLKSMLAQFDEAEWDD